MLYKILKTLVLPPTSLFVLLLVGWLLQRRWPRLGRSFLLLLLAVTYLATTPFLAGELMAPLQPYAPVELSQPDPDVGAIVVLSAGVYAKAPEYAQPETADQGTDAAGNLTLQRLQYAARLFKATGTPILVSGGPIAGGSENSIAAVMKQTLEQDFEVPVRWLEDRSEDTFANARLSAALLRAEGIERIYLVTHAWHMPRAMIAFGTTGLDITPAPTRFFSRADPLLIDFVPSVQALRATFYAVHEWIGIVWYRLRA